MSMPTLSEFLDAFPIPLQHMPPIPHGKDKPWVFWSGSQNVSSSADLGTSMICNKVISAFSKIKLSRGFIAQFWAPIKSGRRRLLSTSGQPFAVCSFHSDFSMYRLYSVKYQYNIDVNKVDNEAEGDYIIMSGGPATAFIRRVPYWNQLEWIPSKNCDYWSSWNFSIMLPICFPSQNSCIGVLEFTLDRNVYDLGYFVSKVITAIKEAGLTVIHVQDLIPYQAINGLKVAKDDIEEAVKVVCESHNLALAQVWIACEDKSHVLLSSSLEDTQTNRLLGIKLMGYLYVVSNYDYNEFDPYLKLCDVTPRRIGEELSQETLQDNESRYISYLRSDMLVDWDGDYFSECSALVVCLRSIDTGDLNYTFEFIWIKHTNYVNFLEAILLTLKRCLPRFKLASGIELGDELDVIVGKNSNDETEKLKIFSKAPDKGKKPTIVSYIAPSEVTCKRTPKLLPQELIENIGKTMKDAVKNLQVSLSTFKRKFKELGIPEWQGPNFVKRNTIDSSTIQFNTNEENNGAIQDPSTINITENIVTVKAEYVNYMTKFCLFISQVTFVTLEKEIGMKFKLSSGTYNLTYLDEDGDWILLTSDEEMIDCIKSSTKSDRVVIRLCVMPSSQPSSSWA
ncbi:protein NLP7-like [Bidens hawaiensis]|uniref:protein NLP7-like n=1 Tax=Bidens hawaiensis TaxID=980011 RepID=UPI004048F301